MRELYSTQISKQYESEGALSFVRELDDASKKKLNKILQQRMADRAFIDAETTKASEINQFVHASHATVEGYRGVLGQKDKNGRVPVSR